MSNPCDYFKGIIFCTKCGKRMNKKKNGNLWGFYCSGAKNYGKEFCNSKFVHLEDMLDVIQQHCSIYSKDWSIEKAKLFILRIEIGDEKIIRWRDGLVTKISSSEIIF